MNLPILSDEPDPAENARRAQCPSRRHGGTCGHVDILLGFSFGMPLPRCDACWVMGPTTETAHTYRTSYAATVRSKLLAQDPRDFPTTILSTLYGTSPPDHVTALITERREATSRWTKEVATTWASQPPVRPPLLMRPLLLAISLLSRYLTPKVTPSTFKTRHLSCHGTLPDGTKITDPCPSRRESRRSPNHYCGDCGCGDTLLASISGPYSKLSKHPLLYCPRRRPGFSNSESQPVPRDQVVPAPH